MNIKKIIAAISALALSAALLTACSGNGNNEESTSAPSETPAVTDESDTSESQTEPEEETSAEEDTGETDNADADGSETDSANPLQPLADAALAVGEWPDLWEVTDPQMLSDFFLLDAGNENYRNMIVLQCPMSALMTEVIIIEAEDAESAKTDLEARRQKAIDQDAFYPNDVDLANASIIGTEGNYAYFILSENAAEAEPALVEAIKAL